MQKSKAVSKEASNKLSNKSQELGEILSYVRLTQKCNFWKRNELKPYKPPSLEYEGGSTIIFSRGGTGKSSEPEDPKQ